MALPGGSCRELKRREDIFYMFEYSLLSGWRTAGIPPVALPGGSCRELKRQEDIYMLSIHYYLVGVPQSYLRSSSRGAHAESSKGAEIFWHAKYLNLNGPPGGLLYIFFSLPGGPDHGGALHLLFGPVRLGILIPTQGRDDGVDGVDGVFSLPGGLDHGGALHLLFGPVRLGILIPTQGRVNVDIPRHLVSGRHALEKAEEAEQEETQEGRGERRRKSKKEKGQEKEGRREVKEVHRF